MARYILTGNTYAYRDTLKAAGAKWDAERKVWVISADRKGRCPKEVASLKGVDWRREVSQ